MNDSSGSAPPSDPSRVPNTATWTDAGGTGEPQEVPDLPPAQIGRFAVLRRLGAGAMGVVYSAYDEDLDRRVAIKVLSTKRESPKGDARMLREAQALARLSHPNVVQVYEVGPYKHGVFVAMEFVSGETLRRWPSQEPPPSRAEVIDAYRQAAAGLAAAHDAGLIHRDFKPDNVIVGEDGRVRVLDFGIASVSGQSDAKMESTNPSGRQLVDSGGRLTRTGQFLGTPAYMSPEQLRGQPIDARSDQFSFCVALYEALYRRRPFGSGTVVDLVSNVLEGKFVQPPAEADVPAWLRAILLRGLAIDPDDRWPDMGALSAALAQDPEARRARTRQWALGVGAVAVIGGAIAWSAGVGSERCGGAPEKLAAVWGESRKATIGEAMAATEVTFADEAWAKAAASVDDFTAHWQRSFVSACEANARGEQSAHALDLRMACLEGRRRELDALLREFESPDGGVVAMAPTAVLALAPVAACDDLDALVSRKLPEPTPDEQGTVDLLRDDYVLAEAQLRAGRYDAARATLDRLLPRLKEIEYRPFRADAITLSAAVYTRSGDFRRSTEAAREAYYLALAAGYDERAVSLAIRMMIELGSHQGLFDEAEPWVRVAESLVHRLGDPDDVRSNYLNALGSVRERAGRLDEAEAAMLEGLALREGAGDPASLASSYNSLAFVYQGREEYEKAEAYLRKAGDSWAEAFGPSHPQVSDAHNNLGTIYLRMKRLDDAEKSFLHALSIRKAALGDSNPRVAHLANNLGTVALDRKKFDEARNWFTQSLEVLERALGEQDPALALVLINLGDVERRQGNPGASLPFYRRALEINQAAKGADHPDLSWELTSLGQAYLELDQFDDARVTLARAIEMRERGGFPPNRVAQSRYPYAKALFALGDEALAREHGQRAATEYATEPENRAKVETWLVGIGSSAGG